jgi:acyl-CoA thioesterase I
MKTAFTANKLFLIATIFIYSTLTYANPNKIIVLGDSISAGYGLKNADKGWVHIFSNKLTQEFADFEVINASVSGDTTVNGLARLPELLKVHQPKIVIIELGGNDGLRVTPLKTFRSNLEKLIQSSQQHGASVILAGMQLPPSLGPFYTQPFSQTYQDLAKQYQTHLVPFLLEGIGGNEKLMQPDGIHPNDSAQTLIVDNVYPIVKRAIKNQAIMQQEH